ncbi:MAG: DNA repair protein RadC [Thermodesulfobacteriota bacterium]
MAEKPHYLAHRSRLRKRFRKTDGNSLHEYELLELLLTYAIPRVDVKPIAKRLLERFGGLSGVLDASQEELVGINDIGPVSATLIRLVKALCVSYSVQRMRNKDILSSPESVLDFSRLKLTGLANEALMAIYVNVKNQVIEYEMLNEGTVDNVVIYPRRIIEGALRYHASGLIIVHNHPSGNPEPSEEDRVLTRSLSEISKTLDIRLLDHIIVGRNGHFSFRERKAL